MPRYVVVLPLEPLASGQTFRTRDWPLHITVVQNFEAAASAASIAALLGGSSVTVTAGEDELFGHGQSMPVTVVEPSPGIMALHRELLTRLAPVAPVFETPQFTGDGYRPHVTIKKFGRVQPGDVLMLTQLALVDMEKGQPDGARRVLAVVPLAEGA